MIKVGWGDFIIINLNIVIAIVLIFIISFIINVVTAALSLSPDLGSNELLLRTFQRFPNSVRYSCHHQLDSG